MKKILSMILIGILCLSFVGCGADTKVQGKKSSGDIKKQYEKIRQDFIAIKKDLSVDNIKKITGIKPTTIQDGVQKYGETIFEYKFDYGFDYEAYIKLYYSHNPKSIYPYDTTRVELKCPDEFFKNSDLDLSGITQEEFKADVDRGFKVSAINNLAGGNGFADRYEKSAKTGFVDVTSLVWADEKGNYIKSSLRGDETVALTDKTLSLVNYTLRQ